MLAICVKSIFKKIYFNSGELIIKPLVRITCVIIGLLCIQYAIYDPSVLYKEFDMFIKAPTLTEIE